MHASGAMANTPLEPTGPNWCHLTFKFRSLGRTATRSRWKCSAVVTLAITLRSKRFADSTTIVMSEARAQTVGARWGGARSLQPGLTLTHAHWRRCHIKMS